MPADPRLPADLQPKKATRRRAAKKAAPRRTTKAKPRCVILEGDLGPDQSSCPAAGDVEVLLADGYRLAAAYWAAAGAGRYVWVFTLDE